MLLFCRCPISPQAFVETDAFGYEFGATLMQGNRPIVFYCRFAEYLHNTWGSPVRAREKFIYEKELIAIYLVVQKWKHYLLGRHFVICMDQQESGKSEQTIKIG